MDDEFVTKVKLCMVPSSCQRGNGQGSISSPSSPNASAKECSKGWNNAGNSLQDHLDAFGLGENSGGSGDKQIHNQNKATINCKPL